MCLELCENLCFGFIYSWWYNSTLGSHFTCCDKCCRCRCFDDDGPLPEEEEEVDGAQRRFGQTTRAEAGDMVEDEDLPRYEENKGMQLAQPGRAELLDRGSGGEVGPLNVDSTATTTTTTAPSSSPVNDVVNRAGTTT